MERRAKWIGRDDAASATKCVVPGCGGIAVATVRIDNVESRAWVVDRDAHKAFHNGQDLCARHADALEAGPGWIVYDERGRDRRITPSVDGARRARARADAIEIPVAPVSLPGVDLRRGRIEDDEDALADSPDLLDAQSPLLARAFAKSRD
jgi:hypothetical protein